MGFEIRESLTPEVKSKNRGQRSRNSAPKKPRKAGDLATLVQTIVQVHERTKLEAAKAVNISLTLRNWLIGCYIAEYELRGADRAVYGENLLSELSTRLDRHGVSNSGRRQLYQYSSFYRTYPQIVRTLSAQLAMSPQTLLETLSYSHFELLAGIDDSLKRSFYEVECVRGNWSFRELRRQVASLYYERAGLSRNKKKLSELTQAKAQPQNAKEIIRDPYVFEFLGLKPKEVMGESDLENALLDKLENFLLELGHGFCFEARQKRILIDGEHFFVDLVFYHRILKCHVLIELRASGFLRSAAGTGRSARRSSWSHRPEQGKARRSSSMACSARSLFLKQSLGARPGLRTAIKEFGPRICSIPSAP